MMRPTVRPIEAAHDSNDSSDDDWSILSMHPEQEHDDQAPQAPSGAHLSDILNFTVDSDWIRRCWYFCIQGVFDMGSYEHATWI